MAVDELVKICGVRKEYRDAGDMVAALAGVDLSVSQGEFLSVVGASGSGKTTLLMILGGMAAPTEGTVTVAGHEVYGVGARARASFRAAKIGFVFQSYHLVPYLSVLDNVMLAKGLASQQQAIDLLVELGLGDRLKHVPSQLSAGERQRTGLARAMVNQPPLILADEPTGNLDEDNAVAIYEILDRYRKNGGTVIAVTHGKVASQYADRTLRMSSGRIEPI